MRVLRVCPVLMFALVFAAPAAAQSAISLGGGDVVAQYDVSVTVTGHVQIDFAGDASAGCAAHGLCGYSGSDTWTPGGQGLLGLVKYLHHHRFSYQALTVLGDGQTASTTYARVIGPDGDACQDAQTSSPAVVVSSVRRGSVSMSLNGVHAGLLDTRCAGPLDPDIRSALVDRSISIKAAEHGRRTINLAGRGSFASHGFSGSVTSTVVLRLGRPRRQGSESAGSPGPRSQRFREVTATFGSAQLAGRPVARIRGASNRDLCTVLDSCGAAGTLEFGIPSRSGTGDLSALGPARLPYRDFLFALGLARHGSARGIQVDGFMQFPSSTVTERLVQGPEICTDSSPAYLEGSLGVSNGGFDVAVGPALFDDSPPRTRCPGPTAQGPPAWVASPPLAGALRGRTLVFDLRPARSSTDDGYVITPTGGLSLTVRRLSVSSQTFQEPTD